MKKMALLSLLSLTLLSGCWWRKKKCIVTEPTAESCAVANPVVTKETTVTVKKQTRTSGPMQKEIGWSHTDYQ